MIRFNSFKKFSTSCLVVLLVLPLFGFFRANDWIPISNVSVAIRSPGPNLLLTRKRIEEVKLAISSRNIIAISAYNELIKEADMLLYTTPNPIRGKIRIPLFYSKKQHIQQMYSRQIGTDALSSYTLALAYAFSGNKVYADKSWEFLIAWIEQCTGPADGGDFWDMLTGSKKGDTPIVTSYHFPKFIMAFDILNGLSAISEEDANRFRKWLKPFVDYMRSYDPFLPNNHLSWKAVFLLTAGRALGDINVFCEGLDTIRYALRIQMARNGSMPFELIRKDRASSYTLMNLEALVQAIWIAENHGVLSLRGIQSILGGDIKSACRDFIELLLDPIKWHSKYRVVIRSEQIRTPDYPSDWAWVFEIPINWFLEDEGLTRTMKNIIGDRIYSKYPPRSYTMQFATLLFRRF